MRKFLSILAYVCIAAAILSLPVVLFLVMDANGYFDTGDTGSTGAPLLANSVNVHAAEVVAETEIADQVFVVLVDTLEKRSHAGGGENLGYWQKGDTITARAVCRQGDDVWIQFDGGWSAAKFAGRIFVNPPVEAVEVCDE